MNAPTRAAIALAVSLSLAAPAAAFACINKETWRKSTVHDAQRLLVKGKTERAYRIVKKDGPDAYALGLPLTAARAKGTQAITLRVLAVVAIRTQGRLGPWSRAPLTSAEERQVAVAWSAEVLSALSRLRPDDLYTKALFAEGLGVVGDIPGAKAILDDLARRKLMPNGRSFAVLAGLRKAVGDDRGAVEAANACLARAKTVSLCGVPDYGAPPKRSPRFIDGKGKPAT